MVIPYSETSESHRASHPYASILNSPQKDLALFNLGSCSLNDALMVDDIIEEVEISTEGHVEAKTDNREDIFYTPDYANDVVSYLMVS